MQTETALALTAPYHVEELQTLENHLTRHAAAGEAFDHFIAVGCGNLRYLDVALRFCKTYTAVEPNLQGQIDPDKKNYLEKHRHIHVISKSFTQVTPNELPKGRKLFFFLFNVFPYIEGALSTQRALANPGDGIVISSWNDDNFEARCLQKIYYDYLNDAHGCSIARSHFNGYIDEVEKRSAVFCSGAERLKGKTTDILTLKV